MLFTDYGLLPKVWGVLSFGLRLSFFGSAECAIGIAGRYDMDGTPKHEARDFDLYETNAK